jgi:hypothetical protein
MPDRLGLEPTAPAKLLGHLASGEAVYRDMKGELAIERDHEFLSSPNPEELTEIQALGLDKTPESAQA